MSDFTTFVHVTGSSREMGSDLPYLRKIIACVYNNQAMVSRNWIEAAYRRNIMGVKNEEADWHKIKKENIEAIRRSDMVIVETTQNRFSQGYQTYLASQYKKPTLVVTRSQVEDRFISGIENKYISVKPYKTEEELEMLVSNFIQKHMVPQKDLRFNMILNRRIAKYLRDKSYEVRKNKSEIIRELLEHEIKRHHSS